MYSVDEIFARLQNGESAEVIANEMADVINQAVAKAEEEESRKKYNHMVNEAAKKAAEGLNELLVLYDLHEEDVTPEDIINLIEAVLDLKMGLQSLIAPKEEKVNNKNADKILNDFLSAWGLK